MEVAEGAVLAEFMSPADEAHLAAIEAQQAKARAKREATEASPLLFDQALLQEQSYLRAEQSQLKGFAFDLQRSIRETEKNRTDLGSTWGREKSQLEVELAATEAELNGAVSKLEMATRALQRAQELQKRGLTYEQTLDQRVSEHTIAELNLRRYTSVKTSTTNRLKALNARYRADDGSFERHLEALKTDFSAVQSSLSAVTAHLNEAEARVGGDRQRAQRAVTREVEAAEQDLAILAAERDRLLEAAQVKAPFAGRVVYRAAAPGLVADRAPILAISRGMGFTAKIRMPRDELEQLATTKRRLQLALEEPVLHKFFTGRFVRAEPVAFESDRIIAHIDSALPPEIIAFLGETPKLAQVRLLWRPSLLSQRGFQIGLILLAAGFLVITRRLRSLADWKSLRGFISERTKVIRTRGGHQDNAASEESTGQSEAHALPALAALFHRQLRMSQLQLATLAGIERALAADPLKACKILREELEIDMELGRAAKRWVDLQEDQVGSRLAAVLKMVKPLGRAA